MRHLHLVPAVVSSFTHWPWFLAREPWIQPLCAAPVIEPLYEFDIHDVTCLRCWRAFTEMKVRAACLGEDVFMVG